MEYIIGTRGSKLALAQAGYVCKRLTEAYPKDRFQLQVIKTKGDLILDKPLHEIGEKGLFVKEIESQLLSGNIHIGVHSMKDMPASPAPGLMFSKAWEREDPRDALILRECRLLKDLPKGAVIGTGSKRREYQLKQLRPDIKTVNIRGNIDTRLKKMEEERLDGIILAAAGLHRLGMQHKISQYFTPKEMLPAPAQGILALELLKGEESLCAMLDALSDEASYLCAEAERGFLAQIGGSCHVPVGALLQKAEDGNYLLSAMFGNAPGTKLAFTSATGSDPLSLPAKAAASIRRQIAGTVTLVGAGPGDPGLITVKGLRAIQAADCIVYDRLASPQLLEEAKPGCEMIYVGKASRNHTMKQEEINQLLVRKSMEYENVVRLKGGDVYVFGRGGEEGLFLAEHGVPFTVIPGVSSCIAGPAYAGIPITHRGHSLGFRVVTAHDRNDALADLDFQSMANSKETCVFLMGLSKLGEIAAQLMQAGMPGSQKAAVISHATTPEQKTCVSDLAHIADDVQKARLSSPALIIVGNVVSLQAKLDFFEQRPLFGKRYLIPKIGAAPTRLRELLQAHGAAVDEFQVGNIVTAQTTLSPALFETGSWLIFTSQNSVSAFFEILTANKLDLRSLAGCNIAAIGTKTAGALQAHGLYPDLVPGSYHSDALAGELKRRLSGNERVLYLKAKNADSHWTKTLDGCCHLEEIPVYENQPVTPDTSSLQPLSSYDGVLFTCASSAKRLINALGTGFGTCTLYSIGPKTTSALIAHGISFIQEAPASTYEDLVRCCILPLDSRKKQ